MAEPRAIREVDSSSKPETVEPIYTQPSTRVLLTWTPVQIRNAESSANGGGIAQAAELVDNLLADDRIGGAIETRTGGLQGLPLAFEDGRGGEAGDSPYADDLTNDWWQSYPETELKQIAAWGIVLGIGFGEQVWGLNADGRFAPRLKFWHAKHALWNHTLQRWQMRTENEGLVTIEPDDPKWIVYTPYGKDRPWARGLWRGLARWWMLKSYAISDWGLHGEQASRLVIESVQSDARAQASTKSQRAQLSEDLQGLGKDGVIALPDNFTVQLLEATANTRDIYGAQIEAANEACVIAINGQNLTTSVEGGSLAAANVHERVEARRLRSDGETWSTTIRAQSLVWWALWNYGKSAVAPWPAWETDPPEDLANKAEVFDVTAEALSKLRVAGYEVVDDEQMAQDLGLPEIRKTEARDVEGEGNPGDGGADGAPAPDGGDGSGSAGDSRSGGEPAKQAPATPQALASGLPIAAASGFVDGQEYADRLAAQGARVQALGNRNGGFIDRLVEALEEEDFDAIRTAVLQVYEDEEPPEDIAGLIEGLFVMAQRAGEVAVDQDV